MDKKYLYIKRCFDISRLGNGNTSPNPNVGCVILFENEIIGEGWHQLYGKAHAEVNAFESIRKERENMLPQSTLFVSLEPCSHFGKTPPCADLIVKKNIRSVEIAYSDPNPEVAGKGIKILEVNNIDVLLSNFSKADRKETGFFSYMQVLRPFFTKILQTRPYIILKWAESSDGFMGKEGERVQISNAFTARLVHKWRSECDGILVGTNTVLTDNPELNNRHYFGKSPTRIVLDKEKKIPPTHHIYNSVAKTIVYTEKVEAYQKEEVSNTIEIKPLNFKEDMLTHLLADLLSKNIAILFVEGGAALLNSFIEQGLWDEARVIKSPKILRGGITAPILPKELKFSSETLDDNVVESYLKF